MGMPSKGYRAEYILVHKIEEFSPGICIGDIFSVDSWSKGGFTLIRKANAAKYVVTNRQLDRCFVHIG